MADTIRTRRVAELIKQALASILTKEINNPHIHDVVITQVKVTKDLGIARIYFSSYDRKSIGEIEDGLNKSKGFIRKKIMEQVHLRRMPQILFERDNTQLGVERLDDIFRQLHSDDNCSPDDKVLDDNNEAGE